MVDMYGRALSVVSVLVRCSTVCSCVMSRLIGELGHNYSVATNTVCWSVVGHVLYHDISCKCTQILRNSQKKVSFASIAGTISACYIRSPINVSPVLAL